MKKIIKFIFLLIIMFIPNFIKASQEILNYRTNNGIKVLYVKSENIPMIDIKITFDAGSNKDGKLKGLSMLAHNLLDEGTKEMNAEEIASVFESTGAVFHTSVSKDKSSISLRSLTQKNYLGPSIEMFLKLLSESLFPNKELSLHKETVISSILEDEADPGAISSNLFFKELYENHPYAFSAQGNIDSIKKIKREDVINFYKFNINASNASIAIVSSLSNEEVIDLAEKISKSLNKVVKKSEYFEKDVIKNAKLKNLYQKINSQQSHIYIGGLSVKYGSKNQFPLYVGNYIFGGSGFNSKLMQELRVKRGFTYGVYSYAYPMKDIGPFVINMETKSEQAQESVSLIHEMLNKFYLEGPTDKELEHAKKAIINGFPLKVKSNSDILNYLSLINYYNLPEDYLDTFTSKIFKITKEDILRSFKEEIDVDKLVTLVVGNEKAKKK